MWGTGRITDEILGIDRPLFFFNSVPKWRNYTKVANWPVGSLHIRGRAKDIERPLLFSHSHRIVVQEIQHT
jgi:hypothetical protein